MFPIHGLGVCIYTGISACYAYNLHTYRGIACCPHTYTTYALQVRALQTSGWQNDAKSFGEYAAVVMQLTRRYMEGAKSGRRGLRDLGSSRMQLKSLIKQVS
jgi:hypothetical protein